MTAAYLALKHQRFLEELGFCDDVEDVDIKQVTAVCEKHLSSAGFPISQTLVDMMQCLDDFVDWRRKPHEHLCNLFEEKLRQFLSKLEIFDDPESVGLFTLDRAMNTTFTDAMHPEKQILKAEHQDLLNWRHLREGRDPAALPADAFWKLTLPFNVFGSASVSSRSKESENVETQKESDVVGPSRNCDFGSVSMSSRSPENETVKNQKEGNVVRPSRKVQDMATKSEDVFGRASMSSRFQESENVEADTSKQQRTLKEDSVLRPSRNPKAKATEQKVVSPHKVRPSKKRKLNVKASPCEDAPHCARFVKKHGARSETRQLEYKLLYAAQAHCLRCLEHLASLPDLNLQCHSQQRSAWDWAHSSTDGKSEHTSIPGDIHRWLQQHNITTYSELSH